MARAWVRVEFNHLPRIDAEAKTAIARALDVVATEVWGECVRLVVEHAFLTGNLAGSLRPRKVSDLRWVVETHVEYAPYVHDGTYRMAARPWFVWAADAKQGAMRVAVAAALGGLK